MKRLVSFYIISLLCFNGFAYANQTAPSKSKSANIKQQSKPGFKFSERKILKEPVEHEQVSSFSSEELRIGAQRIPDKAEIQYLKSQCRYAFMSDKEVIENRCSIKNISLPK